MGALNTIAWLFGVWLKYGMIYGVVTGAVVSLILAFVENNRLKKDKNCKTHLWTNVPMIVFLCLVAFYSVAQFFLKDWAQSLIDSNA